MVRESAVERITDPDVASRLYDTVRPVQDTNGDGPLVGPDIGCSGDVEDLGKAGLAEVMGAAWGGTVLLEVAQLERGWRGLFDGDKDGRSEEARDGVGDELVIVLEVVRGDGAAGA